MKLSIFNKLQISIILLFETEFKKSDDSFIFINLKIIEKNFY